MLKRIIQWLSLRLGFCAFCYKNAEGGMYCWDITTKQPFVICPKCADESEDDNEPR